MRRTAIVAYSGGLDTSCILAWLKEESYGFDEVVAVLVDVGQEFDLDESIVRASAAGAEEVLVVDRKDAFAGGAVRASYRDQRALRGQVPARFRALAAGHRAGGRRDRPRARRRGGRPRLHGKGQRPASLRAGLQGALPRRAGDRSAARSDLDARRGDRVRALPRHSGRADGRLPVLDRREPLRARRSRPGSSRIRGTLRRMSPTRSRRTRRRRLRPSRSSSASSAAFRFHSTVRTLPLAALIAGMNRVAGAYGIGRIDMIENRAVGIKSREVYEAAGRDRADHGALRARGRRSHEGRVTAEAAARAALDRARVRGALVQPCA